MTDTVYAYDALGRLDTVTTVERFDTPLATPEVTDYFYDLLGNLDETHSPNGVISDYQYDNLNRLELLRHFRDVGDSNQTYESGVDALLAEYDYELLADGRRSSVSEIDHLGNTTQINWTYDNANRLVRESYNSHDDTQDFITDYVFDLVGNRLAKKTDTNPTFTGDPTFDEVTTNTHDANDRLTTETHDAPGTTEDRHTVYTYDNTQQIGKTVHAGLDNAAPIASQTDYAYNVQGRMATVSIDADGNGLSDTRLDYEYNDRGIRTSQTKTTDGNNDGDFNDPEDTSERTDYLVDEHNPTGYAQILEEWLDGQLSKTYTLAHDVFAEAAAASQVRHLLKDGHGSTRMLVDALGLPLSSEIYRYDAYGNPIGFDPANALTTLLYSGEQTDAATGLQYLRARYYDPSTGTFNRFDPFFGNLHDPQSLHKYLYTHGNPTNGIDPTGRSFFAFDGTGNWEYQMNEGVWSPTNVWKMYKASSDPNRHYFRGPGNDADYSGLIHLFGRAFGYDMSGILDDAWEDLLADRRQGDYRADIVGFSRGGILATEFANRIADAFPDEEIRFVGLYDPVGSIGFPGRFGEYRYELPSNVQHASQAISRHEDRSFFPCTNVSAAAQKWFRGVHSDIGGGFADHRLSDYVLQWMLGQATDAGMTLNLNRTLAEQYRGQNLTFTPDPLGPINQNSSFTNWFRLIGTVQRWNGKLDFALSRGMPITGMGHLNSFISEMAFSMSFSLGF